MYLWKCSGIAASKGRTWRSHFGFQSSECHGTWPFTQNRDLCLSVSPPTSWSIVARGSNYQTSHFCSIMPWLITLVDIVWLQNAWISSKMALGLHFTYELLITYKISKQERKITKQAPITWKLITYFIHYCHRISPMNYTFLSFNHNHLQF